MANYPPCAPNAYLPTRTASPAMLVVVAMAFLSGLPRRVTLSPRQPLLLLISSLRIQRPTGNH